MDIKKVIATTVASSMMITSVVSFANSVSAYRLSVKYTEVSVKLSGLTDENLKNVPLSSILDNMTYASDVYADDETESNTSDASEPTTSDDNNSSEPTENEPATSDDNNSSETTESEPTTSDDNSSSETTESEPTTSDDNSSSEPTENGSATSDDNNSSEPTESEPAASDDNSSSEPTENGSATSDDNNSSEPTESEPAASDDNNSSEPTESEPTASDDNGSSEPIENVDVNAEFQNGEPVFEVTAGDPIETETVRELIHRKDDKVEFGADAAYIKINDEVYSLSDETATVNLYVPGSPDDYVLVKEIIVASDESFGSDAEYYKANIFITKNHWSFEEFRFYIENEREEKVYLKTRPGREIDNSVTFAVFSALERNKNVYLEAVPQLIQNEIVRGDVEIEVTYHGTSLKAENILTDGQIALDLRAFDENGELVTEQYGLTVAVAGEAFLLSAGIFAEDASANTDGTFALNSKLNDMTEIGLSFDIASNASEFALTLEKLALLLSDTELGEADVLGAFIGRHNSLEELPEDLSDIAAELFGEGLTTADGTEFTLFIDPASVPDLVSEDTAAFVIHISVSINVTEPGSTDPDTSEPTTSDTETSEPNTSEPTTSDTETSEPNTSEPTTSDTETSEPNTSEPTTSDTETSEPDTSEPTTSDTETSEPNTSEPTTSDTETSEPNTSEPTTSDTETSEPNTSEPNTSEPTTSDTETSEPNTSEPTTSDTETSEPNTSEPTTSDTETSEPDTSEPEEPEEPDPVIKLYSSFGNSKTIRFSNITVDSCELLLAYSGGDLSDLEIALINADNIALGETEIIPGEEAAELLAVFDLLEGEEEYSGVIRIRINAVKDGYGKLFRGDIYGLLTISAAYAEPLDIVIDGSTEILRVMERGNGDTPVKYVPFNTEFKLEGDIDYTDVSFSASGLPYGLDIDSKTGAISGIPEISGEFIATIFATVYFTDENDVLQRVVISREAKLDVSANSVRNLHMNTDPNYAINSFLSDTFNGKAYCLDESDVAQPKEIILMGDCAEFVDLWINGTKIKRKSDDYKTLHGYTSIKFSENALANYEQDEIYTMVFGFKSAESGRMIYAAQNFMIVEDKDAVATVSELSLEDLKDVYIPSNKINDELDPDIYGVLASVKVYADRATYRYGDRLIVKPYFAESDYPTMTIKMVGENGTPVEKSSNLTARITLPESYLDKQVCLYEIDNGNYTSIDYIDLKDGRLFFTLDPSKSYAVCDLLDDPAYAEANSGMIVSGATAVRQSSDANPVTGIAVSGAGIVLSGAALVLIFVTGKRLGSKTTKQK